MDCGLLLWIGKVNLEEIIKVMSRLEKHKYKNESDPVGGHGAGIALIKDFQIILFKIGGDEEPARRLHEKIGNLEISYPLVLGHVRRASKIFLKSIPYSWSSQPYLCQCLKNKVVSIHNGFIENYRELYFQTRNIHVYESYNPQVLPAPAIIDSEVIPHVYASLLKEGSIEEATIKLYERIRGNSTWITLATINKKVYVGIYHRGRTRGLSIFIGRNKLIAITRAEVLKNLSEDLEKEVEIGFREEAYKLLLYEVFLQRENVNIKRVFSLRR